jgi:phospholipid transport system substrate-binding protein
MTRSTSPTNPKRLADLFLAALLAVALVASNAAAAAGPRDVVRQLGDEVLAVLRDKSMSSDQKRERILEISKRGVDFETLSRLVLARNWSRLTPDEQARFQEEFRRHLAVTYGKAVDNYRNEDMVILSDREEARGDWTVKTKIPRGGEDILVDYRLRQANGEWKIIDFIVEGVSLVSNFRSQFQDLLASKTPAQLIDLLHEKNVRGESIVKDKPKETS